MKRMIRYAAQALLALALVGVALAQSVVSVLPGWNQLGNGYHAQIDVPSTFADAATIESVWKWLPATGKWAYYSPQLADGGVAFAASQGFDALSTITDGEGYWVNAVQGFNFTPPTGTAVATSEFKTVGALALSTGWNQVSIGYAKTASGFNNTLSDVTPAPGTIAQSVQSIWVWNTASSKWYFYAPSLDAQGGAVLSNYIAANGYLSFTNPNKLLDGKTGFFVTKDAGTIVPPPTPQAVLATTTTTTTTTTKTTTKTTTNTTTTTTTTTTTSTTTTAAPTTTTTAAPTTTTVAATTTTTLAPTTTTTSTTTTSEPTTTTTAATTTTTLAPTTTTTSTTTTAAPTTTTVAVTTTTTLAPSTPLDFVQGWNLVGNGTDTPIDVATTFAGTNQFVSIWKWVAAQGAWAFHSPALAAQGGTVLADYVAAKGYQLLGTIAGGEGFWVNAKQPLGVNVPSGNALGVASTNSMLTKGWNLVSIGESAIPKQFCDAQVNGVTSVWAWDARGSAWYFYAPSLDASGGLLNYTASKGYLDFTATGKTLGAGMGFWVNKP